MDQEELKKKAAEGADKAKETAGKAAGKAKEFYGKAKESEIVKKISAKTKLGANAILGIAGGILLVLLVVIIANVGGGSKVSAATDNVVAENNANESKNVKKAKHSTKPNPASDFTYDLTEDGKGVAIIGYNKHHNYGDVFDVVIPSDIEGYPVLELRGRGSTRPRELSFLADSFGVTTGARSLTIPDSVKYITGSIKGSGTTYVDMSKIKFLAGSWTNKSSLAFSAAANTKLVLSEGTYIGFGVPRNATEIVLPKGNYANNLEYKYSVSFDYAYEDERLAYIFNPHSERVENIIEDARKRGLSQNDIDAYFTATYIGAGAFVDTDITEMVFPEGLEVIPYKVCKDCKNLKKVSFPSSLKAINGEAFSGCENLTEIVMPEGAKYEYDGRDVFLNTGFKIKQRQMLKDTGYTGRFFGIEGE